MNDEHNLLPYPQKRIQRIQLKFIYFFKKINILDMKGSFAFSRDEMQLVHFK